MTIPRSPSLDLIHPLVECGYNVPWLQKEHIFDKEDIEELTNDCFKTARKACSVCRTLLPIQTTINKPYCSVACRQIGKK